MALESIGTMRQREEPYLLKIPLLMKPESLELITRKAYDLLFGCISETRTPVSYTLLESPVYLLLDVLCDADNGGYRIHFRTNANEVNVTPGTLIDLGDNLYDVVGHS